MAPALCSRKICRVCLNHNTITLPLSTKIKSITVAEMINICTSVLIQIGDEYPQNLCMKCLNNLNISFEFKALCENSKQQWLEFYKNNEATVCNSKKDNISDEEECGKLFINNEISIKKEALKTENECKTYCDFEDRKETSLSSEEYLNDCFNVAIKPSRKTDSAIVSHLIKNKQLTLKTLKPNLRYVKNDSQPRIIINFDRRFLIEEYPFKDLVNNIKDEEGLSIFSTDNKRKHRDKNHIMKLRNKNIRKPDVLHSYDSEGSFHNDDDSDDTEFNVIKTETLPEDKLLGQGEGIILNYHPKYIEQKCIMSKKLKEKKVKEPKRKGIKSHYEQTICPICGKMLRSNMKRHIDVFHKGKRLFTCNICQRTFKDKAYLLDHENQHTGNKKYLCTLCGMSFVQLSGYRQHMKTHPEISSNKCSLCPKVFRTPGLLKDHMNIHNGDRKYGCKICQERFFTNATLRRHSIIHKERKQKCELCKKLFHGRHELGRHMLVHTGIKPFQCDICAAKFTQKSDMKKHIMRHFKTMDGSSNNILKSTTTASHYRMTSNPPFVWAGS